MKEAKKQSMSTKNSIFTKPLAGQLKSSNDFETTSYNNNVFNNFVQTAMKEADTNSRMFKNIDSSNTYGVRRQTMNGLAY